MAGPVGDRIRALILSGANNHDWRATTPVLEAMIGDCERFAPPRVIEDPAKIDAALLERFDCIISNWSAFPAMTGHQWGASGEKAFIDFVRRGKGFVSVHAACATCQDWPEYQALVALTWNMGTTGHGAYHTFQVDVEAPDHPIARGLGRFWTTDELWHRALSPGAKEYDVIFKASSQVPFGGSGAYEPALVATKLGEGRGVNLILGHDARAMQNAGFRTLLLRSAEWAATGRVTIPAPADWPSTFALAIAPAFDADAAIRAASAYKHGGDRAALFQIQELTSAAMVSVGEAGDRARRTLAAKLAAALAGDATTEAKAFFCGQLAIAGTEAEVPALAALLVDPDLSFPARAALERIPGSTAGQTLRDAMCAVSGALRIGLVASVGERRDREAVGALVAFLAGDPAIAAATAAALGRIGGAEAAAALVDAHAKAAGDARARLADALLACAEGLARDGESEEAKRIYRRLAAAGEPEIIRRAAIEGLGAAGKRP
ncbi:MAG: ThuA domain-containing protein [Planctomycetes bacterium]|nr:ThuA domain-containing protein [Planctomycetota bacterium]